MKTLKPGWFRLSELAVHSLNPLGVGIRLEGVPNLRWELVFTRGSFGGFPFGPFIYYYC